MANRKPVRTRGKIKLSRYFQKLEEGDRVAVVAEKAMQPRFPKQLQGKTGVVKEKRGNSYLIKIKDQNKEKGFVISPVHLKKVK